MNLHDHYMAQIIIVVVLVKLKLLVGLISQKNI